MVFLLPSWANAPREMKKGGKVKKARKSKTAGVSQKVNVNVKIGDTVLLRKGNAPRRGNPGVAKRFLSQGSAFGGGLPVPLSSVSYASAPQVAMPLGRMDFISSGDGLHSRGRDRRDDIQVAVNPSGIRPDVSPSVRMVQNTNAEASPDRGLNNSRALQNQYDDLNSHISLTRFQGDVPRVGGANLQPSVRAAENNPSTGFLSSKASSSSSASASAWDQISHYKSPGYGSPPSSLARASSSSASASVSQPGRDRPHFSRRPKEETQVYSPSFLRPPQSKRAPPVDPQQLRGRGGSVF